jgi:phosphonate transport system permease protein
VTLLELDPSAPSRPRSIALSPPWDRRRLLLSAVAVAGVATVVWAWRHLDMTFSGIGTGVSDVANLLERMLPPAFADLDRTIELALETFFIALLGTSLAAALSVPVAVLAARNTTLGGMGRRGARAVIAVCRAVPDLVFAAVFVRALGIGVLPGVMAVALHSIGMIGKLFADAIEEIDEGPRDAVRSAGAGRIQELATAVFPQVQPAWIATFLYRLDINVRSSVVLGLVGAGGIGFALQASLRGLDYDQALGIVVVIAVLVIGVELLSTALRRSILGEATTTERRTRLTYLGLLGLAIAYAAVSVDLSPVELVTGLPEIARTFGAMFPPSLGGLTAADLAEPMLVTIAVGLVSTVMATVCAIPIGLLAARNVAPFRWIATGTRVSLVAWRAIPELILAVVFVAAVGLGPVGGVLALAIGSIPFLAKLVADAVEEIDPGPREAVLATGATRLQETATSVLPQVVPGLVGSVLYLLDVNIRTSTILGIVGGGGIGFLLFNSMRVLQLDVTGAILIVIFGAIYAVEALSGWLRRLLL